MPVLKFLQKYFCIFYEFFGIMKMQRLDDMEILFENRLTILQPWMMAAVVSMVVSIAKCDYTLQAIW